jgi:hypothetical protein
MLLSLPLMIRSPGPSFLEIETYYHHQQADDQDYHGGNVGITPFQNREEACGSEESQQSVARVRSLARVMVQGENGHCGPSSLLPQLIRKTGQAPRAQPVSLLLRPTDRRGTSSGLRWASSCALGQRARASEMPVPYTFAPLLARCCRTQFTHSIGSGRGGQAGEFHEG